MPGYRGDAERTKVLAIRLTPAEKQRWIEYAGWAGVSAMVRYAVARLMQEQRDLGKVHNLDRY